MSPRPTYPSDERRRKTRPHVRVLLGARHHRIMAPAFASREDRALLVGLWMVSMEAHATATGNIVTLTHADLCWIADRQQPPAALRALAGTCARVGYKLWVHGRGEPVPSWRELRADLARAPRRPGADPTRAPRGPGADPAPLPRQFGAVSIHVRKLAEKQGLGSADRGEVRVATSASEVPSPRTEDPSPSKSRTPPADAGSGASHSTPRGTPQTPKPMPAEAERLARLLADCAAARLGEAARPRRYRPWAEEVRKLHRDGDGPSWADIEAAIRWLYSEANEGQYRVEVQSGRALREKWPRVVAAMQRASAPSASEQRRARGRAAAERVAREGW